MTWRGTRLSADQRDLAAMLDALANDRAIDLSDDDPATIARVRKELAELGVWTLGVSEEHGGGGADPFTVGAAMERLGRHWPALGWASTQTHAALDALGDLESDAYANLRDGLHSGTTTIAVVDSAAVHVQLDSTGARLTGAIDRVDTSADAPSVLVLDGANRAILIPSAATASVPIRRTGLDGALTRSLTVDAAAEDIVEVTGPGIAAAHIRLMLGATAVAAGIAGAASDDALEYTRSRHQFGGPLTAIPTVRLSLFDQSARTAVLDSLALCATDDLVTATGLARHACADAIDVATSALQSHGGYGYLSEYPAERHLRDAISLRAATDVDGAAERAAALLVGRPSNPTLIKEAS